MPAYTYRSSGAVVRNGTGAAIDLSGSLPAGHQSGDLLLLFTGQRVGPSLNAVSGYTDILTFINSQGIACQGRIADGSAADGPSSVDWTGTNECLAWLEAYSGDVYTDLATILAHSATGSNSQTDPLVPAFTPATVNNCLLIAFTFKNNTLFDATTITAPASGSLVKRTQHLAAAGGRAHAATASFQQTTAADYDGTGFTINGTAESLSTRGMILYLKTASAAVTPVLMRQYRQRRA